MDELAGLLVTAENRLDPVARMDERAVQALDELDEPYLAAGAKGVLQSADVETLEALYAKVTDHEFLSSAARQLAIHLQESDPDRARHYRQEAARLSATKP